MKKKRFNLLNYLIKKFGYNTPIILSDIKINNYSDIWLKKELSKLCKENKMIHFDKGIYYIPVLTELGPSKLNPYKVTERKYISNGNNVYGYYSGMTLLNGLGLTSQVPNVVELYTNSEQVNTREVKVGSMRVILRKARCNINKANVATLIFLELISNIQPKEMNKYSKEKIVEYIDSNKIKKADVSKYSSYFPDKTLRNLIESGVIYEIKR